MNKKENPVTIAVTGFFVVRGTGLENPNSHISSFLTVLNHTDWSGFFDSFFHFMFSCIVSVYPNKGKNKGNFYNRVDVSLP